ncbi:MAG: hypothetical protein R3F31_05970 [Verrucomicrobiales bacterium]
MKIQKLICLCGVCVYCGASGYARTFTNQAGKSMEADVVSVSGDNVKLKRADGKEYQLPLATLSEADQAFLKGWKPDVPGDKPDPVPETPTDPDLKPGGLQAGLQRPRGGPQGHPCVLSGQAVCGL